MPRNLPTYSTCAGPGVAHPHTQLGGLAGIVIRAWYVSGVLTVVGALAILIGLIVAGGPFGCVAAGIAIVAALGDIKDWYYNERLLCIADDECAVGTVISEPTAAFDGDRKLNLMLAPYTQLETRLALNQHLENNRAVLEDATNFTDGFHPGGPPLLPTPAVLAGDPTQLQNYLGQLDGDDPVGGDGDSDMYNQMTIGLVDTLLDPANVGVDGNPKSFQQRFYRKDPSVITDAATWAAIPNDQDATVDWQAGNQLSDDTLNPQFRFTNGHSVPYLHCEVEGNAFAIFIDDLIIAVTGFTIGCAVCAATGPFAILCGAVVGGLFWLFKKLWDWLTGNDGDAAEPDVDWDDPNFTGYPGVTETTGDIVLTFGDWIMDTEHHEYFEIHPVRAYYVIAESSAPDEAGTPVDSNDGPNFDPSRITSDDVRRMCQIANSAERDDPRDTTTVDSRKGLSFGLMTHYGGGGVARDG